MPRRAPDLELLAIAFCYALGSVVFGVVIGRMWYREDLRQRDNPGGSGSWRQYGPAVGITVAVLDVAKGIVAISLSQGWGLSGGYLVAAAAAVVGGHNWPVWFGFRGGGGLGTLAGVLLVLAPRQLALALALTAGVAFLYRRGNLRRTFKIAALPAGASAGIPFFIALAVIQQDLVAAQAALASGLLVGLRGVQMLKKTRPG
jgi:acyl-phosphate glycerol 3-phosphate acyltransferase